MCQQPSARISIVAKFMIPGGLWASLIAREADHWLFYTSRPQPASGHREAGTQVAQRRHHIGSAFNQGDVEGSGRHHGDDDEEQGGGEDEPL